MWAILFQPQCVDQNLAGKPDIHFQPQWLNSVLTHWGRVTHICVSELSTIGSDNGLSPGRCQAIIWTNAGILLIGPLGTNFSEILIKIHIFSLKKIHLKMSSAKWRLFGLGLNELKWTSFKCSWVRSRNCGCLVTWFCYQLIVKPGNKTATVPWPDPAALNNFNTGSLIKSLVIG